MTIATPEGLEQMIAAAQSYRRLVRAARRDLNPAGLGAGELIQSACECAGIPVDDAAVQRRAVERRIAKIEEHLGSIETLIDGVGGQAQFAARQVQEHETQRQHAARKLKL
jgi:hypothetical protein